MTGLEREAANWDRHVARGALMEPELGCFSDDRQPCAIRTTLLDK